MRGRSLLRSVVSEVFRYAADAGRKITRRGNRVAVVDRLSLVPHELHGHATGDPGQLQAPNRRPAEIVHEATRDPGLPTRHSPRVVTVADGHAHAVKDLRYDLELLGFD